MKDIRFEDLFSTRIVGTMHQFKTKKQQSRFFRNYAQGTVLQVKREPKNKHDPNACAVYCRRKRIGYIPRQSAAVLAPLLDRGHKYKFFVFSFQIHFEGLGILPMLDLLGIRVDDRRG